MEKTDTIKLVLPRGSYANVSEDIVYEIKRYRNPQDITIVCDHDYWPESIENSEYGVPDPTYFAFYKGAIFVKICDNLAPESVHGSKSLRHSHDDDEFNLLASEKAYKAKSLISNLFHIDFSETNKPGFKNRRADIINKLYYQNLAKDIVLIDDAFFVRLRHPCFISSIESIGIHVGALCDLGNLANFADPVSLVFQRTDILDADYLGVGDLKANVVSISSKFDGMSPTNKACLALLRYNKKLIDVPDALTSDIIKRRMRTLYVLRTIFKSESKYLEKLSDKKISILANCKDAYQVVADFDVQADLMVKDHPIAFDLLNCLGYEAWEMSADWMPSSEAMEILDTVIEFLKSHEIANGF